MLLGIKAVYVNARPNIHSVKTGQEVEVVGTIGVIQSSYSYSRRRYSRVSIAIIRLCV